MSWPCDCLVYWKIKNRDMLQEKKLGPEGVYCYTMVARKRVYGLE